ncbi:MULTISPECIES: DUF475 domain-containing protein [Streptomycetaceae]|uniref:DUF475 domain-containing protein n=1 Tax=Streptantibioticus cattleyicolor (strain ATCC 35852 / DSM 46488 / JCM 4925 / NBRC 14057 / NRRL 8057) TaxID=1003195 RepID=F8K494_STREN|nr:DUF475 domain-containing protein [Streptantibioticus cattleyicolor]AEW93847.1 hypothetical protein SCATT_14760 [Streptantibioticus cattleyicolor NRRL 8057 = DSM 46488]MYS58531.1 DUF475 domain-containing protein [Streptomyces sp. SID5468]CCB74196.1 Integral membrane protein [Streptantibioticus cattleyicolor NRRL 8057 = DSM 46488]
MLVRTFGWSLAVTAVALAFSAVVWGWEGLAVVAILSVLEISLSFDNAVINAGILRKLSPFWQRIFLTFGVLIAVFGMRLVFPVVIVAITAKIGPIEAVKVAVNEPTRYEHLVTSAHPAIAAFGGVFLLMIFLDFLFEEREISWLGWLERPLARLGKLESLSVVVALVVLLVAAMTVATEVPVHGGGTVDKTATVLLAGVAGLITYLVVGGVSGFFEDRLEEAEDDESEEAAPAPRTGSVIGLAGKAAFFMFLYLEVIDASFSFDGVIGAFAITNDIFKMALGLGIGALYIRSLTVFLVRKGTLDDYVYLEHGAHYAIGALAVILLLTIKFEVNEVVTGLIGVVLIAASFGSSVVRNRRLGEGSGQPDRQAEVATKV